MWFNETGFCFCALVVRQAAINAIPKKTIANLMSFFILYFFFKNKTIIYLEGKNTNFSQDKNYKKNSASPILKSIIVNNHIRFSEFFRRLSSCHSNYFHTCCFRRFDSYCGVFKYQAIFW